MKKTLVFAMAMALGVSATAFAANPFSDLPAGHWAYASVAKLAAAGIVDGYPDGSFKGGKLMTRYEMAQIVAKALAKGAIGADDKLVSEFADELDSLGARVAKLEKNADNVKITGQARFSYADTEYKADDEKVKAHAPKLRTRLWLTGEVNDNWHYESMLQNEQNFVDEGRDYGNEGTSFQRANLKGNIGAAKITAGRYSEAIMDGNFYDSRIDGIKAEIGKNVKFTAEYGKMANATSEKKTRGDKFYRFGLGGNMGALALDANYVNVTDAGKYDQFGITGTADTWYNVGDLKVWNIGAKYKTDNWGLGAMYLKGSNDAFDAADISQTGYVIDLNIGAAKAAKPGTVGFNAKYYNQGASTFLAHTMNGAYDAFELEGFKGYMLGLDYTVAKNMVAGFQYYDLKGKESDLKAKTMWSQLIVTF